MVMGTVAYMSPEQLRCRPLDSRSDLFTFGMVLHEMLAGSLPFAGSSYAETASAILKEEAQRLEDLDLDLSGKVLVEVQRILDKCLAKEPAERYQSAADLVVDLRNLRRLEEASSRGGSTGLRKPGPTGRYRRAMTAAVLVFIGFVGVWFIRSDFLQQRPEDRSATATSQRSVAILGFQNLSRSSESAWLSTALAEMLGTELSAGARINVIPGEDVSRMKIELSLVDSVSFGKDTLVRIRNNIGADFVVLGSYTALGEKSNSEIRLGARHQREAARITSNRVTLRACILRL